LRQLFEIAEIRVVAVPLAGQHRVQGMVEVVAPLGIEPVTADGWRPNQARIVEIAFGDEMEGPAQPPPALGDGFRQFRQRASSRVRPGPWESAGLRARPDALPPARATAPTG
jgi:hypothetical protein